ncbi:MAG: helix-turn-helix domain-containing protein [Nitrospira sp.]|nr:helix-turn-helix domain-containing protein [Nitrospira sp.]
MKLQDYIEPEYFDLQALAAYSSCSVRWLRDRLVDQFRPLPHYRIEGKILVKREEFDHWLSACRVASPADGLNDIIDSVMAQVRLSKRVA